MKIEKEKKIFSHVIITLESAEEVDLFYHLTNYSGGPKNFYCMAGYEATFEEMSDFRHKLWEAMDRTAGRLKRSSVSNDECRCSDCDLKH